MGCESWVFSDTHKPLLVGRKAFVPLPTGGCITEPGYGGYGIFGDKGIYDLVTDWNRSYLSEHPEHYLPGSQKEVCKFNWYAYYADLSIAADCLLDMLIADSIVYEYFEFRYIGIDISCNDKDNASLPFPIKICQLKKNAHYANLSASIHDCGQGL